MHLTLVRPDDWHLHLRDGADLRSVVAHTAKQFARAIVMPNLKPPVATVEAAVAYRERILEALGGLPLEPLMTLYLTPETTAATVRAAAAHPHVHAIKMYPAGATTNSDAGVQDLSLLQPVLETMAEVGLPLLIHGESIASSVDIFDREARFIDETLAPLADRYPTLPLVLEHVTTEQGVRFVEQARPRVAATITPQHLLYSRNALFQGGLQPDLFCLPVLKREEHRLALLGAATSGSQRFFLGTDSAPHARGRKYGPCGCAGVYSAHAALPIYADIFEQAGALDKLEGFASLYGPDFYGLPRNTEQVTLVRKPWTVPSEYSFGDSVVTPLLAGQQVNWQLGSPRPH